MRIFGKSCLSLKTLFCAAIVSSIAGFIVPTETLADSWGGRSGGSWGGSSGGSWGGSNGSAGGGGLFGGRRPVRNLLGRIGDRFHGGSNGGSTGGSTGFAYSSHGSNGSTGYGYAYNGGSSYGSTGISYGSSGGGHGSVGSYGSVGTSYGSVGSATPMTYSNFGGSYTAPVIYDSGYSPSLSPTSTDTFQPVPGINYEGGPGNPTPAQRNDSEFQPPNPAVQGDGSTGIIPQRTTVLSLKVPVDANVFINDHKTKTAGEIRRYVSRNLDADRNYYYHVKAVVVREGKEIVRNEMVTLKAGDAETVEFDFSKPVTSLALTVPDNAKVTLCGKSTNASGVSRHFSTTKLEPGQTWNDYTVEVSVEKNGRVIRQEKKLELVGGETYKLHFEFDESNEMLAVR